MDILVISIAILFGLAGHFLKIDFSLTTWAQQRTQKNVYLTGFILTFVGNASILFPIAYAFGIIILAATLPSPSSIFLFGTVCGVAGGIGEMTAYSLGYIGRKKLSDEAISNLKYMEQRFGRSKPFLIFLAAALPIPDEFVVVPFASAGYPLRKMVVFSILGKMILCLVLAFAGPLWSWGVSSATGRSSLPFSVLSPTFILLFYLFIRIDWAELLKNDNMQEVSSP